VLTLAKQIADTMHRLKTIRQPFGAVLKGHTLDEGQKKMIHRYLKIFNKCEKQDYEIADDPMNLKIAALISLGYEKSNSISDYSDAGLNTSFEIRLLANNVQGVEKDEFENEGLSTPVTEELSTPLNEGQTTPVNEEQSSPVNGEVPLFLTPPIADKKLVGLKSKC
jgi:hypothetical protein